MDAVEFENRNRRAQEAARVGLCHSREVGLRNGEFPFRGFIACHAAPGQRSFMMFNNADDVVAAHYLHSGPASFEPETLRLWVHLCRSAGWIYDVGAFTGVFSLAAATANPSCFVMAFEPSWVTYSRLLINIAANDLAGQIAPVRCGLGAEVGTLDLRHPSGVYVLSSNESFVSDRVTDPWFSEPVPVLTLDHLLANQESYKTELVLGMNFPTVDLVKIDVEGFELDVLAGMRGVFERDRPTMIVELFDLAEIGPIRRITGADYRAFYVDQLPFTPEGANVLFLHPDKLSQLRDYQISPGLLFELTDAGARIDAAKLTP